MVKVFNDHKWKLLTAFVLVLTLGLFGVIASPVSAITSGTDVNYYLHGTAPALTLDNTAPTGATAKYKDSPAINRTVYKVIGTWIDPVAAPTDLQLKLSPLDVWLGLKNSDDQGTWFDLKAEVLKNGVAVAEGTLTNIKGVTRNPNLALKVTVNFSPLNVTFNPGDTLSLRISAKVTAVGGHSSAVGLRLYYDAVTRASNFGATPQYQLTMATNFGTTSPAAGNSWYDAGSVVTIQATAPAAGAGESYVWNGWTGIGAISYSGNNNPANNAVIMNGPVSETASWTHNIGPTLYENYINGDDNAAAAWASFRMAQTFTPAISHSITSVKLLLYRVGNAPGTVTVEIRAMTGGTPDGTANVLATATSNGNTLTASTAGEWREFTFTGCNVVAGTQYAIVVHSGGGNGTQAAYWRYDGTSPSYGGGAYWRSTSSGVWTSASTDKDFLFEEWGN